MRGWDGNKANETERALEYKIEYGVFHDFFACLKQNLLEFYSLSSAWAENNVINTICDLTVLIEIIHTLCVQAHKSKCTFNFASSKCYLVVFKIIATKEKKTFFSQSLPHRCISVIVWSYTFTQIIHTYTNILPKSERTD